MKTFFRLIILLVISNCAFAQQQVTNSTLPKQVPSFPTKLTPVTKVPLAEELKNMNSQRGTGSTWMNYAVDYASLIGSGPFYSLMLIFPDTNIVGTVSGGQKITPFYHAAATYLDPYSFYNVFVSPGDSYSMDSLAIKYAYLRALDSTIVDTLIVTVMTSSPTPGHSFYGSIGSQLMKWVVVPYDYQTNSIDNSVVVSKITYLLTPKDSSVENISAGTVDVKTILLGVSNVPTINYDNVIGVALQFIPGYTYGYNNTDSIFGKDAFFVYSSEENGLNTDQTLNDTTNMNVSYVLTTDSRYGDTSDAFYGQFFPAFGYVAAFEYENHLILFHLTSNNLGVKELVVGNGLNFYPNPTNEIANISYNLKNDVQQISLKIFDITGKEILDNETGPQAAGVHKMQVNSEAFTKGMYLYSFSVDGQTINGKFIVD